jgi:hypothetical protein
MNIVEEIERRIGGLPIGDPAAMRAYARRLEAEAEAIAARARAVTGTVEGARYQSPSATRLKAGAADTEARLLSAAARLQELAASVLRAASSVEADQQWWHGEFARIAHELERSL